MTGEFTELDRLLGIELRHLAALSAIVEEGSFVRAAERLGYSQSAISHQISALERAAGMRLLDRPVGTRTVTLTDAGERLLRHARRAVATMRAAEAELRALAEGESGTLRVGTFQSAAVRLLPRVMRTFVARRPGIEVRLVEAGYDEELVRALDAGAIELSFLLAPDDPAFATLPVLRDPFVLLAPASSDVGRDGRPLRPRDVAELPLIGYRREEGGEKLLRERGVDPEIVFRSDESGVIQGLVGAGVGYALVPLLTVTPARDVRVVDVRSLPPREIVLAWLADRSLSPGAHAFVDVVREVADELARADSAATLTAP